MKTVGALTAAALLLAFSTVSYAQDNSSTAPEDKDKGKTGWTGGAQGQPSQDGQVGQSQAKPVEAKPAETTGQKIEIHDEAKAKDQPAVATGKDLKGPPAQFAPSKTPE